MADPQATPQRALRDAMGSFATGVTIVTTRSAAGEDIGRTANSFSSVSLDPPMILWSLARSSSSHAAFAEARHFAVHVLAADQDELSGRFAGKSADRFAGLEAERGADGIPLLRHCAARFECRTVYRYDGGDHVIFVGEVTGFQRSDAAPLLFHGGRYGRLVRQPAAPATPERPETLGAGNLAWLLSRSFHELRAASAEARAKLDLTDPHYAVLTLLGHRDGLPLAHVLPLASQRGAEVGRCDCAALAERGLVRMDPQPDAPDPALHLTEAGRDTLIRVVAAIRAAEADLLGRLAEEDARVLLDLLGALARSDSRGWPPALPA
ncbi:flavin reductase [Salipiger manganoxidans]|uniref:flavin reductase n=1 Tax=Salipiger marinus TaxID=555512 RepID=UPI001E5BE27B|nr:flavin reductase [Salipiger manganoxidans]MCD1618665.1 flavin reductase [Salipiger manganoxidans]